MRLANIMIVILAMLKIAKPERSRRKFYISKNSFLFQRSRIRFCFKNQWKLKKLAQNMYPAIKQVVFRRSNRSEIEIQSDCQAVDLSNILRIARSTLFQSIPKSIC